LPEPNWKSKSKAAIFNLLVISNGLSGVARFQASATDFAGAQRADCRWQPSMLWTMKFFTAEPGQTP